MNDLSGGLLRKLDPSKLPTKFARDLRNMRSKTGVPTTRAGNAILTNLPRPAGGLDFPGDTAAYLEVPLNGSCPLFTGLTDFTIEAIERPEANPSPAADAILLALGQSAASTSFAIRSPSGSPLNRQFVYRDENDSVDQILLMGAHDDGGGGDPEDRRYYYRIRRRARVLDSLIVGAASGSQYKIDETAFGAADDLMDIPTSSLFIGGKGPGGSTKGVNSVVSMVRIWRRWIPDDPKLYWTDRPALEDDDILLDLRLVDGTATLEPDTGLWENHAEVNGTVPAAGSDDKEALMVGQFLGEYSPLGELHRIVIGGGDLFREVVR